MPASRRRHLLLAGLAAGVAARHAAAQAPAPAAPTPPAAPSAPAQAGELRLGAIFPLSGPLALLGDESYRGLEMAVEERNEAGGVLGRALRLLRADAPDVEKAQAEARRLSAPAGGAGAASERVAMIFGTHDSTLSLAASQVAELAGTPFVELTATADQVTERGFRLLARTCPRTSDMARLAVEAVPELIAPLQSTPPGALRIAVLTDDDTQGQAIGAALEARIKEAGLNLVERATQPTQVAEMAALVRRLQGADTHLVLHAGQQDDATHLFRGFREAGWWPRMVLGLGGGYGLRETAQAVGPAFEGTMVVDLPQGEIADRAAPGARAFAEAYRKRYGADPRSGHSLAAHVGARLALDALQRAGGPDPAKFRAAMLSTEVAKGGLANGWGARFDERGQNLRAQPLLMQWREGGRLLAVHPADAAVAPARARLLAAG
jgi:branched-chain amino acid transport system substrate-binding protein